MNIKALRFPFILLLIGALIIVLGSGLKVMNQSFASYVLILGMVIEGIGLVQLVAKFAKNFNSRRKLE